VEWTTYLFFSSCIRLISSKTQPEFLWAGFSGGVPQSGLQAGCPGGTKPNMSTHHCWGYSNKGTKTLTGFFATFYALRTFGNSAVPEIGACLLGRFWRLIQPVHPHLFRVR
jgi:hypothetical protein